MEKIKLGLIALLLCGCAPKSTVKPVIGEQFPAPGAWSDPVNGWCVRHRSDIDCSKLVK